MAITPLMPVYGRCEVEPVRGEGCYLFDEAGNKWLDMAAGIAVNALGHSHPHLIGTIQNTVTGVVHGIFGTALAQAMVAVIGFLIAGVPAAFLLGVGTFLLSLVPIGPPLIWGGAAIWLVSEGQTGWAIFMVLWGLLAISSIDNVVKPFLISRAANLPLLLIVLGALGGVVAFGFIGIFIGPPVLAVGLTLLQFWIARTRAAPGTPDKPDTPGVA